ncbi:MAG: helix-turn-helix transcriptional regulator [Clostridia bacterium]|nr:helix-turn-helix transcriptional regulator [Clostridia bacterium]
MHFLAAGLRHSKHILYPLRLKHNKPITTVTINDLCEILDCSVEDIVEYVKE